MPDLSPDETPFGEWAIVELFGRVRLAGFVSEQTIAGAGFVRVDIPADPGDNLPAETKFYGPSAIYGMHPVSEVAARAVAARCRSAPVHRWGLPAPPARVNPEPGDDGYDEWAAEDMAMATDSDPDYGKDLDDEMERDRLEAERDEARAKRDQVVENAVAWMDEARHQAVERDRLAATIADLAKTGDEALDELGRLGTDEGLRADNERLTAELDETRKRVAHYERCIDWDATCKACAAGLDISHELAMRAEEAEAERDRLADTIRRYEPVIEAARVWLLPKGNTVEIDNAHNALEDAIEALGDASEAHPNPYRAASVMPHYPRIAAERTVVEAAKAWRAARPGPWTGGADVEFGLLCAVDALGEASTHPEPGPARAGRFEELLAAEHEQFDRRGELLRSIVEYRDAPSTTVAALGDVGADPDGEQKTAHPAASADIRTGPDTLSWADAAARVSADAQEIEASREDLAEREGQRYADLADETGDDRG